MYCLAAVIISPRSAHSLKSSSQFIKDEKVRNVGRHRGTKSLVQAAVNLSKLGPAPNFFSSKSFSVIRCSIRFRCFSVSVYKRRFCGRKLRYDGTCADQTPNGSLKIRINPGRQSLYKFACDSIRWFVDYSLPGLVGILKSNLDSGWARFDFILWFWSESTELAE